MRCLARNLGANIRIGFLYVCDGMIDVGSDFHCQSSAIGNLASIFMHPVVVCKSPSWMSHSTSSRLGFARVLKLVLLREHWIQNKSPSVVRMDSLIHIPYKRTGFGTAPWTRLCSITPACAISWSAECRNGMMFCVPSSSKSNLNPSWVECNNSSTVTGVVVEKVRPYACCNLVIEIGKDLCTMSSDCIRGVLYVRVAVLSMIIGMRANIPFCNSVKHIPIGR